VALVGAFSALNPGQDGTRSCCASSPRSCRLGSLLGSRGLTRPVSDRGIVAICARSERPGFELSGQFNHSRRGRGRQSGERAPTQFSDPPGPNRRARRSEGRGSPRWLGCRRGVPTCAADGRGSLAKVALRSPWRPQSSDRKYLQLRTFADANARGRAAFSPLCGRVRWGRRWGSDQEQAKPPMISGDVDG
jgi:hypothetical protein